MVINFLSPTKWWNTLKQFVGKFQIYLVVLNNQGHYFWKFWQARKQWGGKCRVSGKVKKVMWHMNRESVIYFVISFSFLPQVTVFLRIFIWSGSIYMLLNEDTTKCWFGYLFDPLRVPVGLFLTTPM